MNNDLGSKLVLVTDMKKMILYKAQGLKIGQKISEIEVPIDKHHRVDKSQSTFYKGMGPGSSYEPHTPAKELEHQEAAHFIVQELEKTMKEDKGGEFKNLIIVADHKLLGNIRKELGDHLKKIVSKEVAKDLVNHNIEVVEHAIFA